MKREDIRGGRTSRYNNEDDEDEMPAFKSPLEVNNTEHEVAC